MHQIRDRRFDCISTFLLKEIHKSFLLKNIIKVETKYIRLNKRGVSWVKLLGTLWSVSSFIVQL